MDSSVSPTHGDQEGTAWNGHFGCSCYHPLFLFNPMYIKITLLAVGLTAAVALTGSASAQEDTPKPQVLFTNVNVFDGKADKLATNKRVLVEGNLIKEIGDETLKAAEHATVIDGGGRTLMPGLIESHGHLTFAAITIDDMKNYPAAYAQIIGTVQAKDMLMRGVTSMRDLGGPVFALKRAIDEGMIPGPRIYPSGLLISQTSGHADWRTLNQDHPEFGGQRASLDRENYSKVVDGVPQVLAAARESLRHGASQVKLTAGGGYASQTDPIDSTQFTLEELKAAVDAATDWGTYVAVHVYTPRATNRAIDAGVKVIEHGQLLDEKTLKRMEDEGIWLSTQPFTVCNEPQLSDISNAKLAVVCQGTEFVYKTIKKFPKLKVTYGTDIFNDPDNIDTQVQQMARLQDWHSPYEILVMATGNGGELLKLSGPRNPYPGDLGVVKEAAYADLLLIEGNPLDDIAVIGELDNLKVIMKDGKIYKNTL
jgi:imidazolonepropionase-like amidohydrolase